MLTAVCNEEPEMEGEAWCGRRPHVEAQGCRPTRQNACRQAPGDLAGAAVSVVPAIPSTSCNGPVAQWGTRTPRGDERAAPWTLLPSLWGFHSGSHLTAMSSSDGQAGHAGGRGVFTNARCCGRGVALWAHGDSEGPTARAPAPAAAPGSVQPQAREPQLSQP